MGVNNYKDDDVVDFLYLQPLSLPFWDLVLPTLDLWVPAVSPRVNSQAERSYSDKELEWKREANQHKVKLSITWFLKGLLGLGQFWPAVLAACLEWAPWPVKYCYVVVSLLLQECGSLDQLNELSVLLRYVCDATFINVSDTRLYPDIFSGKKKEKWQLKCREKNGKLNTSGKKMWEIIHTKPSAHLQTHVSIRFLFSLFFFFFIEHVFLKVK